MFEPVSAGQPMARAFLRVGGASLANHQLALLLALECQRVVVLARDLSPGLLAVQQAAEARKVQFHVASDARALARLVTANDELFVLSDGLLADREAARGLLGGGSVVLAQPVEAALAAGFERIDLNHATAGALRMPGRLAEQLAELPVDCDVSSALTRIALQAGVALREIPPELRSSKRWQLVRSEADARAVQDEWLRSAVSGDQAAAPGPTLARGLVLSLGHAMIQAGSGASPAFVASLVLLLVALGLGWFGFAVTGLVACALAVLARLTGALCERAETLAVTGGAHRLLAGALPLLTDASLVALLAWFPSGRVWETAFDRMFAPLVLVLAMHIAPRVLPGSAATWMADRFSLAVILAIAAALGLVTPLVQALALASLVAMIVLARPRGRLTHD